jgi:hypothetical protein
MKSFKDAAGRTWTIAISVDAIKRARGLAGIDLLAALDGELFQKLAEDPVLLVDTIYAVCKPEADKAGVKDEDFGRAMYGDAIEAATDAFLEELISFFPPLKRRPLTKALEKLKNLQTKAWGLVEQEIDGPRMDAKVQSELDKLSASFGSLLGSPASTQAP